MSAALLYVAAGLAVGAFAVVLTAPVDQYRAPWYGLTTTGLLIAACVLVLVALL